MRRPARQTSPTISIFLHAPENQEKKQHQYQYCDGECCEKLPGVSFVQCCLPFFSFCCHVKIGWLLFELNKSQRRNLGIQKETARKISEIRKPRPSRTGLSYF
ncbi:MAG: hypothetical protein HY842_16130 [Bacteroidetes bacterium]|nr:hypothetical protein [Bacteroidota bacterium]